MPEYANHYITYRDYDGELSTVGLKTTPIDGGAVDWDTEEAKRTAIADAIADITLGVRATEGFTQKNVVSLVKAASTAAQRELKWLVFYHDTVTLKPYRLELPCADTSKLDPNDRANAHMGDSGVVDAFVSAFQANALSPDGNSPIVDEITLVGKNV